MMKYACIHTHTAFCDGTGAVEDYCQAAFDKGLVSLGFSAHAPLPRGGGITSDWHLPAERLEAYLDAVRDARRRWETRLPVYLGLEADYIRGVTSPADFSIEELGLDYIIGSVHYVTPPEGAPFCVDGPATEIEAGIRDGFGGDTEAMVNDYWDNVEAMIRGGGFDVLGHVDLVRKNNSGGRLFAETAGFYRARASGAVEVAARYGVTAEVNTGGMNRKKLPDPYPAAFVMKALRANNVPLVINADAHQSGDVDGNYGAARAAMVDAGYKEAVIFEGREDGRPVWRAEKL
jgi:histidinol-phosphatase (PHP family)